ncbi:hypothetical protein D9M68_849600 [compost metagenome]
MQLDFKRQPGHLQGEGNARRRIPEAIHRAVPAELEPVLAEVNPLHVPEITHRPGERLERLQILAFLAFHGHRNG